MTLSREQNIIHANDVCITAIERVITRAEFAFEFATCRQIEITASFADCWLYRVVMVAHGLEEGNARIVLVHGVAHLCHQCRENVQCPGVEKYVA